MPRPHAEAQVNLIGIVATTKLDKGEKIKANVIAQDSVVQRFALYKRGFLIVGHLRFLP
jgi:hypothetical protein